MIKVIATIRNLTSQAVQVLSYQSQFRERVHFADASFSVSTAFVARELPSQNNFLRNGLVLVLIHDLRRVVILFNTSQRLPIHVLLSAKSDLKKKKKKIVQNQRSQLEIVSSKRFVCNVAKIYYILSLSVLENLIKDLGTNTHLKKEENLSHSFI